VFLCAFLARRLFGETAGKFALLFGLFAPTLADMNGEILTEASATLLAAIFLWLIAEYALQPRWNVLLGLGCVVGLGALTRFNMALLGVVVLCVVFLARDGLPRWRSALVVIILPVIVISPWLIRNFTVFHGGCLVFDAFRNGCAARGGGAAGAGFAGRCGKATRGGGLGATRRYRGRMTRAGSNWLRSRCSTSSAGRPRRGSGAEWAGGLSRLK